MMRTSHSSRLSSSTRPAEKPSTGRLRSSGGATSSVRSSVICRHSTATDAAGATTDGRERELGPRRRRTPGHRRRAVPRRVVQTHSARADTRRPPDRSDAPMSWRLRMMLALPDWGVDDRLPEFGVDMVEAAARRGRGVGETGGSEAEKDGRRGETRSLGLGLERVEEGCRGARGVEGRGRGSKGLGRGRICCARGLLRHGPVTPGNYADVTDRPPPPPAARPPRASVLADRRGDAATLHPSTTLSPPAPPPTRHRPQRLLAPDPDELPRLLLHPFPRPPSSHSLVADPQPLPRPGCLLAAGPSRRARPRRRSPTSTASQGRPSWSMTAAWTRRPRSGWTRTRWPGPRPTRRPGRAKV